MQTVLFLALVGCVLVELADACKFGDPIGRKKREAESPAASDPGYPHPTNVHNDHIVHNVHNNLNVHNDHHDHNDHFLGKREAESAAGSDYIDSRPSRWAMLIEHITMLCCC